MSARDHFIKKGIRHNEIVEFLSRELQNAGFGGAEIQKTPLGTRVIIQATKPGVVIGRRGTSVRRLTEILEEEYGLENPQIDVQELDESTFNAKVIAGRFVSALQRGIKYRRIGYGTIRRMSEGGVYGVEIRVAGKLASQRSRYQKFRYGVLAKTGQPSITSVDKAVSHVVLKPGTIGVNVKIMVSGENLPDKVTVYRPKDGVVEKKAPTFVPVEAVPQKIETDTSPSEDIPLEIPPDVESVQPSPEISPPLAKIETPSKADDIPLPQPVIESPSKPKKDDKKKDKKKDDKKKDKDKDKKDKKKDDKKKDKDKDKKDKKKEKK
ncbi:MAG: 30S ribosomal protein S3 [Candidatus Ranarchaeia archaeon]|jgi:small subunit ribosomal protein S3